jgi:glycosyltransferase involved in cell wall biosynthesis
VRKRNSILSLGRIAPSKRVDILLRALNTLKNRAFSAAVYGEPLPKDIGYRDSLERLSKELRLDVQFHSGVPNQKTPEIYSAHDIFVNCSMSGMYDKTIFEAAACGCIVLASSRDFGELAGKQFEFSGAESDLTERLQELLSMNEGDKEKARSKLMSAIQKHSLAELGKRLAALMQYL